MKSTKLEGQDILKAVLNLIRYDIPCLLLGKSSIGKSYSVLTMAKKFKLPHNVLFVGSEKAEHIEGLPKLITTGTATSGKKSLEYFTPWWFPNGVEITERVKNGQIEFKKLLSKVYNTSEIEDLYKFSILHSIFSAFYNSESLSINNEKQYNPIEYVNAQPTYNWGYVNNNIHSDILIYLSTLLGYGNFWLILDEIDKVEAMDIEKYAPLLHIVRERTLKDWSLREINNNKGIDITTMIDSSGSYYPIDDIIERSPSVLDTRVIAVANATSDIEEALFRRFVQVIIEDVLIWDKNALSAEQLNLKMCVDNTIAGSDLMRMNLDFQKVDEVNLQWQFNFLPKMLNQKDAQGNYFVADYLKKISEIKTSVKNKEAYALEYDDKKRETLIFKVLEWSFDTDAKVKKVEKDSKSGKEKVVSTDTYLIDALFDCCKSLIEPTSNLEASPIDKARKDIKQMLYDYNNDVQYVANQILSIVNSSKPTQLDEKITVVVEGKRVQSNLVIDEWLSQCFAWIHASLFDEYNNIDNNGLYKVLIPKLYSAINAFYVDTNNINKISNDNVNNFFAKSDEFWNKVAKSMNVESIELDPKECSLFLHGVTNVNNYTDAATFFKDNKDKVNQSYFGILGSGLTGNGDSVIYNLLYSKTQSFNMARRYASAKLLLTLTELFALTPQEIKDISGYIAYLKKYHKDNLLGIAKYYKDNNQNGVNDVNINAILRIFGQEDFQELRQMFR